MNLLHLIPAIAIAVLSATIPQTIANNNIAINTLSETAKFNIIHRTSGDCWRPQERTTKPSDESAVILHTYCWHPDQLFEFVNGTIKHSASGKCVNLKNPTSFNDDNQLVLRTDCTGGIWNLSPVGLVHVPSRKCVHPRGGAPDSPDNTNLVLWGGCNEPRLMFDRLVVT